MISIAVVVPELLPVPPVQGGAVEHWVQEVCARLDKKNPLRHVAKIQNVYSYGHRVARELSDFDVIYIHNEPNILQFIKKQPGQKIVLHMHNDHLSLRLLRLVYCNTLSKVYKIIFFFIAK